MGESAAVHYDRHELLDQLPSGWTLIWDDAGTGWDASRRCWRCTLRDGMDFDWELTVPAPDVAAVGRREALRRSVERLVRRR